MKKAVILFPIYLIVLVIACDDGYLGDGAVRILGYAEGFDVDNPSWGANAYVSFDFGGSIYFCDGYGKNLEEIPKDELFSAREPDWSPDCKYITFSGYKKGKGYGLYVVNADGAGLKRIYDGETVDDPAWSPSGDCIAFRGSEGIYTISPTGGEPTLIVSNGSRPDWDPLGEYILYSKRIYTTTGERIYDIIIKRISNGEEKVVAKSTVSPYPTWSPDGELIAYCDKGQQERSDVWLVPAKAGTPWRITNEPPGEWISSYGATHPSWSPDSDSIVFSSNRDVHWELWRIEVKR